MSMLTSPEAASYAGLIAAVAAIIVAAIAAYQSHVARRQLKQQEAQTG
jgi:hypothetical protein